MKKEKREYGIKQTKNIHLGVLHAEFSSSKFKTLRAPVSITFKNKTLCLSDYSCILNKEIVFPRAYPEVHCTW